MPARIVNHPAESRAVAAFLSAASNGPAALLVEGEAGIGKTTLLLEAVAEARERGFRVLAARSAAAESVLAYAVLADLLAEVDAGAWAELSDAQRLAVDRVLLRADTDGPVTDPREVAAAFLTVIDHLADDSPVLLVIDDLQWLDPRARRSSPTRRAGSPDASECSAPSAQAQATQTTVRGCKCRDPTRSSGSLCCR